MANEKAHFGPTDRNDQTGHCGPPSKLVPNIPVGPNRNGPFHLMNQPKFPEFWVEWKAPFIQTGRHSLQCVQVTAICSRCALLGRLIHHTLLDQEPQAVEAVRSA